MNSLCSDSYEISIAKEMMAKMPLATFAGQIQVVDHVEDIPAAVADLLSYPVIGFDTETRPSFKRGHNNLVSLLQLARPGKCYLFRLNKTGLDSQLIRLLENPDAKKVGLSIHDDFHNLARLSSIEPKGFTELQTFVRDFLITDSSLQKIYAILFGERISKGQRLTNWEAEHLTQPQQHYAALDAAACIRIYTRLSEGTFIPEQSPYYHHKPLLPAQ